MEPQKGNLGSRSNEATVAIRWYLSCACWSASTCMYVCIHACVCACARMCACVYMCVYRKGDNMEFQENLKYSAWLQNLHQPSSQPSHAFPTLPRAWQQRCISVYTCVCVGFLHLMGRRRLALFYFENNPIENINELIMHTII